MSLFCFQWPPLAEVKKSGLPHRVAVVGGTHRKAAKRVELYEVGTGAWSRIPLQQPVTGGAAVVLCGESGRVRQSVDRRIPRDGNP